MRVFLYPNKVDRSRRSIEGELIGDTHLKCTVIILYSENSIYVEIKRQHQGNQNVLTINVLGMVLAIALGGLAVVAVLAIKISSKRTPHYEQRNYD